MASARGSPPARELRRNNAETIFVRCREELLDLRWKPEIKLHRIGKNHVTVQLTEEFLPGNIRT